MLFEKLVFLEKVKIRSITKSPFKIVVPLTTNKMLYIQSNMYKS